MAKLMVRNSSKFNCL